MQTMTKQYAMKRGHKRKQKAISGHSSPGILTLDGKLLYSIMPLLHRETLYPSQPDNPTKATLRNSPPNSALLVICWSTKGAMKIKAGKTNTNDNDEQTLLFFGSY